MSFNSQSRVNNRGPLIAVITIELDEELSDKIFLHLNDDDLQMAEQFVDKHCISPNMVAHICQKIRYSRKEVQQQQKQQIQQQLKQKQALSHKNATKQFEPLQNPRLSSSPSRTAGPRSLHTYNVTKHEYNKNHEQSPSSSLSSALNFRPHQLKQYSYQQPPKDNHQQALLRKDYEYSSDKLKIQNPITASRQSNRISNNHHLITSQKQEYTEGSQKRRSQQKDLQILRNKYKHGLPSPSPFHDKRSDDDRLLDKSNIIQNRLQRSANSRSPVSPYKYRQSLENDYSIYSNLTNNISNNNISNINQNNNQNNNSFIKDNNNSIYNRSSYRLNTNMNNVNSNNTNIGNINNNVNNSSSTLSNKKYDDDQNISNKIQKMLHGQQQQRNSRRRSELDQSKKYIYTTSDNDQQQQEIGLFEKRLSPERNIRNVIKKPKDIYYQQQEYCESDAVIQKDVDVGVGLKRENLRENLREIVDQKERYNEKSQQRKYQPLLIRRQSPKKDYRYLKEHEEDESRNRNGYVQRQRNGNNNKTVTTTIDDQNNILRRKLAARSIPQKVAQVQPLTIQSFRNHSQHVSGGANHPQASFSPKIGVSTTKQVFYRNHQIQDHLPLGMLGRQTANFKNFGSKDSYKLDIKSMNSYQPENQASNSSNSLEYMSFKKQPRKPNDLPQPQYRHNLYKATAQPSYDAPITQDRSTSQSSRRQIGLIRSNSKSKQLLPHRHRENKSTYEQILYSKSKSKSKLRYKSPPPSSISSGRLQQRNISPSHDVSVVKGNQNDVQSRQQFPNELFDDKSNLFDGQSSNSNINRNRNTVVERRRIHTASTINNRNREESTETLQNFLENQQLFQQIKDLHSVKQNRTMNRQKFNQTSASLKLKQEDKPSRVKFINKSQMYSLKQSSMSRSKSKAQLSKVNRQVTERLYNEQQIKKKYLNAIKSRAKKEQQQEDLENLELTLKPEINQVSKMIAEGRMKDNQCIEEYLFQKGKVVDMKKQDMINHENRLRMQECSFKPQIGEISHKLAASRQKNKMQYRKMSKCRSYTQVKEPFRPEINRLSNALTKGKGDFVKRQQKFLEEKNSKMFKLNQEKKLKQRSDITSGQKLYKPQISSRSKDIVSKDTDRQSKDIYNYLYDLSKKPKVIEKPDGKPTINSQSQKLVEHMYEKRIIWLFSELDNDEDGVISSTKICIDRIPTQILEIIAPVLYEMEELKTELNQDDFKNAIKILNKNIGPHEKSILYNYKYISKNQVF